MILCCEMNNNRDYFSDYNRTNTIYNRCIPSSGTIFLKAIAGKDCGRVGGVLHDTGSFAGASCKENIQDGGARDDFLSFRGSRGLMVRVRLVT